MTLNLSSRRIDSVVDSSYLSRQVINCPGQRDTLRTDYHLVKALAVGWSDRKT
jgi:hypothetical protein